MKNALAHIRFTLDIPEERIKAICKNHGLDPDNEDDYEAICDAVHEWALDNWPDHLELMTGVEPDIEITA